MAVDVAAWEDRVWLSVHDSVNYGPEDEIGSLFEHPRRETMAGQPRWGIGLPFVKKVAES